MNVLLEAPKGQTESAHHGKAIELADDLGIQDIQFERIRCFIRIFTYDTKKRFLDNLRKAAAMQKKTGVCWVFETMKQIYEYSEKAMEICLA